MSIAPQNCKSWRRIVNAIRTALLLAGLTGLFLAAGFVAGGVTGMFLVLVFAAGANLFAYRSSDRLILAMYGARELGDGEAPEVVRIVRLLAENADLPPPRLLLMDSPQPNAFATGRDPEHAALCFTTGLLATLNREELAGVLAHELGHIKRRDTLIMTLTAIIGGAVLMLAALSFLPGGSVRRNNPLGLSVYLFVMLLAPLAAMLVQIASSRSREFEADKLGAEISGHPLWLVSALVHIDHVSSKLADVALAHPLTGNSWQDRFSGAFAGHPSTEERIARLVAMASPSLVNCS